MKKSILTLPVVAAATAFAFVAVSTQANTIQIGTGLDSSGNLLASGATEQHYTVTVPPNSASSSIAYVEPQYPGAWVGNVPFGQWISPLDPSTGSPSQQTGLFTYTLTIDGFGSLSGEFATDNGGELIVNGVVVQTTAGWPNTISGDYQNFTQFSASLSQSVNTIEFIVNNAVYTPDPSLPNPTGLIVQGTATVPDGGTTAMLLGLGLTGLATFRCKVAR